MSDFTAIWSGANPDATNDSEPPADGMYDVVLADAGAFLSKEKQEPWVKLAFRTVADGHEWDVLQGFKSQKQANFTKKTVRDLGVDVDSIAGFEELDGALKEAVGRYFTVEVKTNGEFRNTYLVPDARPDIPVDAAFNATETKTDDDIPF